MIMSVVVVASVIAVATMFVVTLVVALMMREWGYI